MKVFVTGVAGFLGSHLAEALQAEGHDVSGCDNMIGGFRDNVPPGVEFLRLDCNNREALVLLLRGVEVVYHLAATAHEGLSMFSPHENVINGHTASMSVFAAAVQAGVRRIVFTSSMARYGANPVPFTEDMEPDPEDHYGDAKVASERALKRIGKVFGTEWVVAVPHNIYGRRQHYYDPYRNVAAIMINRMLQGKPPIVYGDGEQRRCFSHVSDCIGPLVQMSTTDAVLGEVVNVGPDSEFVTINYLARLLSEVLDFREEPVHVPARPQEVRDATCSADKARRLLGYEPKVLLRDGMADLATWVRERGAHPFSYDHLRLEICNSMTPSTWTERLI